MTVFALLFLFNWGGVISEVRYNFHNNFDWFNLHKQC